MGSEATNPYQPFKLRHAIQLAAPHTWCAAVMPVLLAVALALHCEGSVSPLTALILLVICILMQSSVNAFNDYFDFIRGLDSEDDLLEADDSTLVNDGIDPRGALALAILLLVIAFGLGIPIILESGLTPLWIALAGAVIVFLYSGGPRPLSSLPIGEAVSGFVMGGLIPLACFYVFTGRLDPFVLVCAIPTMIGIGLIMLTNNTCDIEKDGMAAKRTLSVLIGRPRARVVYHGALAVQVALICLYACLWFERALILVPFMLLALIPLLKGMIKNPLTPASRVGAMGQIISLNVAIGAFYASIIII